MGPAVTATIALVLVLLTSSCSVEASSEPWHLAPAAPSLYKQFKDTPHLHVAVMCIPLWGHFKPLFAVADELARRGHRVTYFVEHARWCDTVLSNTSHADWIKCIVLPSHPELFSDQFFQRASTRKYLMASFVDLFKELFAYHETTLPEYVESVQNIHLIHPFTTFLCDITTFSCPATARLFNVPIVHVYPLSTQLSLGLNVALPAMGSGLPRSMTTWQRATNLVLKTVARLLSRQVLRQLNAVRERNGVERYRSIYEAAGLYDTILSPTLWGLDIAQPLCPNVHPLGPLSPLVDSLPMASQLDVETKKFLDECENGALYVNFGTIAHASSSLRHVLVTAFNELPFCVVWRMSKGEMQDPQLEQARQAESKYMIRSWFSSAVGIMKHPNVAALLTHCGDTTILEAVEANLPVLGIPIFADQGDVCQRVQESGIGRYIGHKDTVTASDVQQNVWSVVHNHSSFMARLRDIRATAKVLGGASRAADIVESRQYNLLLRREYALERCWVLRDSAVQPGIMGVEQVPLQVAVFIFFIWAWCAVLAIGYWLYQRVRSELRLKVLPARASKHNRRRNIRIVSRLHQRERNTVATQ